MIVYAGAALLSVALAYFLRIRSAATIDTRSALTYVPLLPYLLVAMLRVGVGKDTVGEWSTYPRVFAQVAYGNSYSELNAQLRIEPGYYIVNKLVVLAGGSVEVVYAATSLIFLGFMYRFIIEQSPKIPLSLLLLFTSDIFMFSLSGIRQATASAIAFYALKYIADRRSVRFFCFLALAASFHISALAFLPLYWFASRRVSTRWVAGLGGLSLLLNLVPGVGRFVVGLAYGDAYFGSKWDYANFNLIPATATVVITGFALVYRRRFVPLRPGADLYVLIMVVNAFVMSISTTLITPTRFYFLLIPAAFVLIPLTLEAARFRRRQVHAPLGFVLVAAVSLQLAYEFATGNDAYGTWDYAWSVRKFLD